MFRAIYHAVAAAYYRWALRSIDPAHPDAGHVQLRHAFHRSALDYFLKRGY